MEFKEGTPVYTNDGQKIGDIERFILDPRGQQIIALVVRKGFLFTEDKVVPLSTVGSANTDQVTLYAHIGDPNKLPTFEEIHYVTPDEADFANEYETTGYSPLYYFPPSSGAGGWYAPHLMVPPQIPVKERNIPAGTVPVKEGAHVISRDGDHIGDVQQVVTDSKSDEITHFVIEKGLFFKEEKLLPSLWVASTKEEEIHLAVSSKTLEKLNA